MDFLKKGQEMLNKAGSGSSNTTQAPAAGQAPVEGQAPVAGQPTAGQSEDYGDKIMDFAQKKSGHTFSRDQNEKATDALRGAYEKSTGNKVDPKYSN